MRGQRLHAYDLQLTEYVHGNVRCHLDDPAFAAYVRRAVRPEPLLDFFLQEDQGSGSLLLSDRELDYLELALQGPAEVTRS